MIKMREKKRLLHVNLIFRNLSYIGNQTLSHVLICCTCSIIYNLSAMSFYIITGRIFTQPQTFCLHIICCDPVIVVIRQ